MNEVERELALKVLAFIRENEQLITEFLDGPSDGPESVIIDSTEKMIAVFGQRKELDLSPLPDRDPIGVVRVVEQLPKAQEIPERPSDSMTGVIPELFEQGYRDGKEGNTLKCFKRSYRLGFRKAKLEEMEEKRKPKR